MSHAPASVTREYTNRMVENTWNEALHVLQSASLALAKRDSRASSIAAKQAQLATILNTLTYWVAEQEQGR